ncbi:MAG: InlB B-repeat-containing protein [Oscillospiraceae bacterium]|nr:InlB B-repeat-containing protein [Oscillospiraceae bacterium]
MLYSSKHYSKVTISRATNYDSNEIPVTGISLNYSTKDLSVGDLFQLTATITPSNATNKNVTWSSGNSYIATVSTSGLVEAKTPGYVVITAKSADGQKTTNCGIWVDIYKVEYDTNGGTGGPTMQFKKKGETLVLSSSVPTKEGYVFAYWSGSDGVNYLPGSSYYQNKHLKLTAVWKERSPTITLDSFECTPNCTTGFNVYIENNDATENLSFDFDFVYDKTAFEIESIETFFPEDGVVSVNGDNVKYDVVNGETSAFSGMFAKVVLKIKDAEIKDYVFTIKVNRWVNGLGNVEPKIVDGIITMNHSACVVHYYSPVECALPEDEVYEYGDEIIIADAPEDEDWEFIYWSDDNGIKYYPGEKVKLVDSSFYLQANWKPKWTPVITVENASGAPGETIVIPVNITNNLHSENTNIYVLIYTGNAIYQDFEGVQGLPVNGNIGTIYVKIPENAKNGDSYIISAVPTTFSVFEENGIIEIYEYVQTKTGVLTVKEPEKEYTVTFDLGKGTGGPEDITVTGNEFTIPEEIPTRENWIFLYWFDDEGMYKPGETYTISKDKELVACWAPAWDPEIVVGDVLVNPGDTVGVPIYIYNAKEPENTTIKFSVTSDTFTRTNYEYASEIPEYGYLMTAYFKIPEDAEPGSYPVIFNLTEYNISSAYYLTEIVKIINGSITVTNQKICTVTFDQNDGWEAYIDKFEEGTSLSFKDIYFEREGYTAECLRITEDGKWGPRTYLADKNDMIYVSNDMEIKTIWRNNSVEYPTISSKEIKAKPGDTVTVQVETSFKNGFDFGEYLLQWENDQNINLKSSYNCSGENENNIIYEFVFEIGDDVAPGKHSWSFSIVEAYTPEGELWAVKDIPITISVEKSNYGDLNGDKEVNIKDAYLARLIAAKLITATEVQSTLGDVDLDGKITAIDANLIRKYVVKLIDSLPIK